MAKYKLLAKQWDQTVSKRNEPYDFVRHRRGDVVELSGVEEKRLLRIGAVEPVKRAAAKSTKTEQKPPPEKPKTDEGNGGGDNGDGGGGGDDQGGQDPDDDTGGQTPDGSAQGAVDKPAKTAPVAAWREYAVAQGHAPDEAADATRADLIAQYG